MTDQINADSESVIGTIENKKDPSQTVIIKYLREENAFVTSGIYSIFAQKELLIPTHLVAIDLQLMGTIISAILEKLSLASETDNAFSYCNEFDVLGKTYSLTERGEYVMLTSKDG